MSIALLIESAISDSAKAQSLLVPTDNEVLVFHRTSTGQRGKGQRWIAVNDLSALPTIPVTRKPVGVVTDKRDSELAKLDSVTALSTKLLALTSDLTPNGAGHKETVNNLLAQLVSGDGQLNAYLPAGEHQIMLTPISPVVEPVIEPSAPVAQTPVDRDNAFISAIAPEPEAKVIPMTKHAQVEMAKVPDKKWADQYLNRKVAGKLDFELLDNAFANHENVLIRGGAGSGKTMCVLAWASARGYRYYNISSNVGLEPSHLFGMWIPTEHAGVFRWQDGPVTELVRNGGVLLLNEIDFMPERITTVLFGLLDDRREIQLLENGGEVIKAHPDLIVVGDHNPNYRGSRPMNQAWKDRFHHKWEFGYDKAIERKLIPNKSLLEVAEKLRASAEKGELDTPISTRSLVTFVRNVKNVGLDYAIDSYLNGFLDDEREGVKVVMETAKANIANDFGIKIDTSAVQSDEVN